MTERKKPTWDTPTPEQIRANVEAVLKNEPGMRGIIKFHGAFKSPMLVSEIPGHRGRINAAEYVFVQPKMDGHCCMANTRTRKIYTRSGREITTLPHINKALPIAGPEWLHGELWKQGCDCDDVQRMVKRGDTSLELWVFDLVDQEPSSARIKYINAKWAEFWKANNSPIRAVESHVIMLDLARSTLSGQGFSQDVSHLFIDIMNKFLIQGYEGIIIRLDGHGYEHRRSANVFKMKPGTEGM